ncbi:aquaporin Z [Caballeronia telluris]|uniref:Aquaporin Z n=2 Tax=Caballeronia telluris TaxID=326475 RepID=A0A158FSP3_9BURK|nr:aquaporin Z [Caballeronia telluris]
MLDRLWPMTPTNNLIGRLTAECAGTFWLVFMGCGSGVLASGYFASYPGLLGQPLMFGFAFITASYVLGPVSGAHFNPAVTVGFAAANRFPVSDLVPYILAQVVGAIAGAGLLYLLMRARPGFEFYQSGLGANGFDSHSPGSFTLQAAFIVEAAMSFVFVTMNLVLAGRRASSMCSPFAIGLALIMIYAFTMPVTGGSINPARSTGPALITGGWALDELWLFWAAPLTGGVLAGLCYPVFHRELASVEARGRAHEVNDVPLH